MSTDAPDTPSTDLAPRQDRAPLAFGVTPQNFEDAWRWASYAAQSLLVPKDYRNKPYDILTAVQLGTEIGLPPMTALQSIAVINGRPGIFGDGLLALILVSPLYGDHVEYFEVGGARQAGLTLEDLKADTTRAVCSFVRRGKPEPVTRTFSVGQAKKAGLLGKEGPWQQYPDRMLQMRARSFAARDAFPDVLKGVHSVEELQDVPADDAPRLVLQAPPAAEKAVRRRSEEPAAVHVEDPAGTEYQPSAAPKEDPPLEIVANVQAIERTLTRTEIVLGNGLVLEVEGDPDDALGELYKYLGKPLHRLRFTYRPIDAGGRLRLVDFIAE
jgi:hypothetical protein